MSCCNKTATNKKRGISDVDYTTPIEAGNGTAAAPQYSFSADTDTGIYREGANNLGISTGGTKRVDVSSTALMSAVPIVNTAGSASAPSYTFTGDTNTGIYSSGADTVNVSTGGTSRVSVDSTGLNMFNSGVIVNTAGSASAPSYTFSGDTNTGIYSSGADTIAISAGGSNRASVNTTALTTTVPIRAPSTASAQFSNSTGTTTGWGFPNSTTIGTYVSGTQTSQCNSSTYTIGSSVNLWCSNSTASTSNTTGAITSSGGISTSNSTDATSSTNGGSMTLAGGAAIAKKLFVGSTVDATTKVNIDSYKAVSTKKSGVTSNILDAYPFNTTYPYSSITGNTSISTTSGSPTVTDVTDANNFTFKDVLSVNNSGYNSTSINATTAAAFTAGEWSIGFWLYTGAYAGALRTIAAVTKASTQGRVVFYRENITDKFRILVYNDSNTIVIECQETTKPTVQTWVHYAFTGSWTAGNKLYRNGIELTTGAGTRTDVNGTTSTAVPQFTATSIYVGNFASLGIGINGALKDFTVSSVAWSANDVLDIMDVGIGTCTIVDELEVARIRYPYVNVTSTPYYLNSKMRVVQLSSGATDVYLPKSTSTSYSFEIVNVSGGSVTIYARGSDVLSAADATSYSLANKTSVQCTCVSGRWCLVASI